MIANAIKIIRSVMMPKRRPIAVVVYRVTKLTMKMGICAAVVVGVAKYVEIGNENGLRGANYADKKRENRIGNGKTVVAVANRHFELLLPDWDSHCCRRERRTGLE